MLEKPGFSAMRPIVVESVRKRILLPLGSWAKSQTGGRNRSFKRNGKRRNAGLSSLNHGNPKTSSVRRNRASYFYPTSSLSDRSGQAEDGADQPCLLARRFLGPPPAARRAGRQAAGPGRCARGAAA